MKNYLKLMALVPVVALTACDNASQTTSKMEQTTNTGNTYEQAYQSISADDLREYTKVISSDEFEGRLPTSLGEKKTLDYLTSELQKLGLQPGNGDSFLQPVELLEITASPDVSLTLGDEQLTYGDTMMLGTKREQESVEFSDSDIVFVGYGINAPEYDWNDYANVDVKGKTVIILVNDPGFENPDSGKFQGKTMTYYGRWTYKYEEASRQGAKAAIIVHETEPASYGWTVVANSWSGPQYGLVTDNGNMDRVAAEGWIPLEVAQNMFRRAGFDFSQEKAKALQGPYARDLNIKASASIHSKLKKSTSYNVLATVPGTTKPDEHIIYTAHWDHLGKDESLTGDQIYNGAQDNATGTAASLTMAKAFMSLANKPERSVSFLIVTAEEQGLLGSYYYSEHPVIPLDKTVANINMDAMNILGKTKDVIVVGKGKSELENYLDAAVKKQGRYLEGEDKPQAGYYYRSDHFSFAKKGVPALYSEGGTVPIDEQTADYRKRMSLITTGCYHQVCDEFRDKWDFSGVQQDTRMLFDVGYHIASSDDWPKWSKTSEFQRQR
ncbi:M28 family metallopeptidase [Neptunicella marina]|uniref:M28 family peptidase n=1 Tax=Neptunicella marina TaxID=2125989 RepID=A0A8J6IRY3_9ALTE|nr:M28 family metallopeptidase [Neptunicella marina]MBC3764486.1 M28 family peptidase [Neptunicella marina]